MIKYIVGIVLAIALFAVGMIAISLSNSP